MAVAEGAKQIDVKEAVQAAKSFANDIFEPEELSALGLEAVERSGDGRFWLVTLGFSRPSLYRKLSKGLVLREPHPEREYKVFRVDARSGEVLGVQLFKE